MMRSLGVVMVTIMPVLAGCMGPTVTEDMLTCPEDRSVFQICTMDYNPVCGLRKDGTEKSYSNSCGACSDTQVLAYQLGECQ
ncbi:hypothetical protein D0544_12485 [Aestuariirhabdus litorea]|uniref:Kazal-like domain-containing protein n=2 Tax=Aestuariirhabdus litorea TaxID=2528527 RepID=A0A3P3VIU9_9GAMM|nr:hypothetical protein D0544_12485 [Aestuariirhabdus litorea]RWW92831.1 hypothetical protein DZC74_12460 [Endozoicomonadaceae bacterium GTF-13]